MNKKSFRYKDMKTEELNTLIAESVLNTEVCVLGIDRRNAKKAYNAILRARAYGYEVMLKKKPDGTYFFFKTKEGDREGFVRNQRKKNISI